MTSRPFLIAGLSLITLLRAMAAPAADKMNSLLTNSPFGSSKTAGVNPSNGGEPFEFRSVSVEGDNKYFSIYDTATKRSNWVELNDPVNGFSVKGYDSAKENITVEYQGKSMTLAIKRAPAIAQVMQQPMPMPTPNGAIIPNNNPTVQTAPTPADQQRIQQIQEEIRRRRALRSQSVVPNMSNGSAQPMPGVQPNYGNGPQPMPNSSNSTGPVPQPSTSGGPQLIPPSP